MITGHDQEFPGIEFSMWHSYLVPKSLCPAWDVICWQDDRYREGNQVLPDVWKRRKVPCRDQVSFLGSSSVPIDRTPQFWLVLIISLLPILKSQASGYISHIMYSPTEGTHHCLSWECKISHRSPWTARYRVCKSKFYIECSHQTRLVHRAPNRIQLSDIAVTKFD